MGAALSQTSKPQRAFPERVGRYELLAPLGSGGMATVYLARSPVVADLHREVALKLMHSRLDASENWSAQLVEEARIAASIRHPNVVPVLEVGDDQHGVYLVMEYVKGDTLSGLLRSAKRSGEKLPLPVVGRIASDVLSGLHAAHQSTGADGAALHLVHRDVSPQNILVGLDGISRLSDFGIAKVTNRTSATASGVIKGKVGYMSPEQAMGGDLDRRSDLWGAGVVLWELVGGERLYPESDDVATLLKIVTEEPRSIREIVPELPDRCAAVIDSALVRDPAARVSTAVRLRHLLHEAWEDCGGLAEPSEVAMWTRRLCDDRLQGLDGEVEQVLEVRRARAANAPPDRITPDTVGWEHQGPSSSGSSRSFRWAVAITSLVVVAVGAMVLASPKEPLSEPIASTTTTLRTLEVTSETPLVGLTVQGRAILVPEPATRIEVQLPAGHQGSLEVMALAQDGRKSTISAPDGSDQLQIEFPAMAASGGSLDATSGEESGASAGGKQRSSSESSSGSTARIPVRSRVSTTVRRPPARPKNGKPAARKAPDPGLAPPPY